LVSWRKSPPPPVIGVVIPPPAPTWWKVHRNEVLGWFAVALFVTGLACGWTAADSFHPAAADSNCTTPAPGNSRRATPPVPVHVPPTKGAAR
jgi:hypothetical protein